MPDIVKIQHSKHRTIRNGGTQSGLLERSKVMNETKKKESGRPVYIHKEKKTTKKAS